MDQQEAHRLASFLSLIVALIYSVQVHRRSLLLAAAAAIVTTQDDLDGSAGCKHADGSSGPGSISA